MNASLPIRPGVVIPSSDLSWSFSRSGGPGGQHANTADTRARLHFALSTCEVLPAGVKRRLRDAHPAWVTTGGDVVLTSDLHRSRHQNVEACRDRLANAVRAVWKPPRPRRPTRPTRASRERRLDAKKARGKKKALRRRPPED